VEFPTKISVYIAVILTAASLSFAEDSGQVVGQGLSVEAKSKDVSEARAKRNGQTFQNKASVLTLLDRYGKQTGQVGERAIYRLLYDGAGEREMYGSAVLSPDGKRVAAIRRDSNNESWDLFVLDVANGAATRLTTSARTEYVYAPVWSPDGNRLAYVSMRGGQERICARAANGQGAEEVLYNNPGANMDLSDWSRDGRFLTFSISDIKGGTLYVLKLEGSPESKPIEILHSDLRIFQAHFSPDGRYLSYLLLDKTTKGEVFVRSSDPAANAGPWQISDGSFSSGFWVGGGKLYYMARDRSLMATEVSTSPSFSFNKPRVLFRQDVPVPDELMDVSADGERFLVLPPARGHELQQITVFDRKGQAVRKVSEPGLYSRPAFSPEGNRLLVKKQDVKTGQWDLWVLDIDTARATRITDDTRPKNTPLWSPDGKYIFYSALLDGDWPVYRKAADGNGKEEMMFRYTPGALLGLTDISPDGKFLFCTSGAVVLLVPLTVSDPTARVPVDYLRDEFNNQDGRLSPDGRFIAYRSDEAKLERFEVYVRPFDATKPADDKKWQVSKDGVIGMFHWRGDGKEIFFRGQELDSDDLDDLVIMAGEVETTPTFRVGTPKVLFRLHGPREGSLGAVRRDGQQFVFAVNVPADRAE
jgi:Tol biopolymer transport system component